MSDTALARLRDVLGPGGVSTDPDHCLGAAEDISGPSPEPPLALAAPTTAEAVAETIRIARDAGLAVYPRGGGLSYTGGYTGGRKDAIALDLTGLNRILTIDTEARFVVVEAGCTWARLYDALAEKGMRTPFFGPLSGFEATVGGALSQNGAFFGSAAQGYAADHVLGLEVADGAGALRKVGAWATGAHPALPWHGPGLVQPFLGDCGALGVKTKAVLPLHPVPSAATFASFAFDDDTAILTALSALRDIPHLSEVWAFDREAHTTLAATGFSVLETAQMAADVAGKSPSLLGAAKSLVQASVLRRAVLTDLAWSLHMVIEPPVDGLNGSIHGAVSAAMDKAGGREIPDTIPRVTRARPFRPIRALIGPAGERWLPCHGLLPVAAAPEGLAAVRRVLQRHARAMAAEGVRVTLLIAAIRDQVIIEPQLYWPDSLTSFQSARSPAKQVAQHQDAPACASARTLAHDLRRTLSDAMSDAGAAHLQIGRYYNYSDRLEPGAADILETLKARMDPDGILNPGVLGVPRAD